MSAKVYDLIIDIVYEAISHCTLKLVSPLKIISFSLYHPLLKFYSQPKERFTQLGLRRR
jgi:hypothetical protein